MACEGVFGQWICDLQQLGLLDVILPFLLVFTIAFAVLQKSRILGPDSKRFNTLVSLALAFAVVVPHVINPGGPGDVVLIINAALPNVSLLMLASLMALLLIGVFGEDINIGGTSLISIVVIAAFIAVAYIFIAAAGGLPDVPWLDDNTRSLVISILVFGLVVMFITKEEDPLEKRKSTRETLNDWFGGLYKKR